MRLGVFAQPVENIARWIDLGTNVFLGWASSKQTSGADPAKDREEQLKWRAAVKAAGAQYVDYILPDWRPVPLAADVQMMLDDPACLGFFGPEEPNLSPPSGNGWRVSLDVWLAYWQPVIAADPNKTKLRVGDFAGNKLSAAWGHYQGNDLPPYFAPLTTLATNWHPRNVYGDTRPDCDVYPSRAVQMLMNKREQGQTIWYISEIADEDLPNTPAGRAPTDAEVKAQIEGVKTVAGDVLDGLFFFPQKPRASAAHVFDNTTPEQRQTVRDIWAPYLSPDPIAELEAQVAVLELQVEAQAQVISEHDAKLKQMGEILSQP